MTAAADAVTRSANIRARIAAARPPGTWIYGGQIEKFYGKAEHRYYMLPDNTIATAPWGGPWPDFTYAQSVCPGYSMSVIPKEADY